MTATTTISETETALPVTVTPTMTANPITTTPTAVAPTFTVTPTTTASPIIVTTTATQTVSPVPPSDPNAGLAYIAGSLFGQGVDGTAGSKGDSRLQPGEDIEYYINVGSQLTELDKRMKTVNVEYSFDPHQTVLNFDVSAEFCSEVSSSRLNSTYSYTFECGPSGVIRMRGRTQQNAQPGEMVSLVVRTSGTDQMGRPLMWTAGGKWFDSVSMPSGGPWVNSRTEIFQFTVS